MRPCTCWAKTPLPGSRKNICSAQFPRDSSWRATMTGRPTHGRSPRAPARCWRSTHCSTTTWASTGSGRGRSASTSRPRRTPSSPSWTFGRRPNSCLDRFRRALRPIKRPHIAKSTCAGRGAAGSARRARPRSVTPGSTPSCARATRSKTIPSGSRSSAASGSRRRCVRPTPRSSSGWCNTPSTASWTSCTSRPATAAASASASAAGRSTSPVCWLTTTCIRN